MFVGLNGVMQRPKNANEEVMVTLFVDEVTVWEVGVDSADFYTPKPITARIPIPAGEHHIKLQWSDNGILYTAFDERVTLEQREIFLLQDIKK